MLRVYVCILISIGLFTGQAAGIANQVHAETGLETLNEYVDLVASGNFQSAEQYWTEESRRRAGRFGIEYIGIPLKVDCASPIVRNPELGMELTPNPIRTETNLQDEEYLRYTFDVLAGTENLTHQFYARRIDQYVWLMFSQDYHCQTWPVKQTKYFDIHYQPEVEKYLNPVVLDEADRFVEKMAGAIGLSEDDLKLLETEKIRYFYCGSDRMVYYITGYLTKGTYDLASDDIISAFFPHFHELTHFLINLKLRHLPLYAVPLFREGAAVLYGGRWGKTPRSMLTLGSYLYKEGVVGLDSILTMSDFEKSAGSDLGYPLSGLFVGYLIDKKGADAFLELYREMSGSFEKVVNLTPADIQSAIAAKIGLAGWEEVVTDFDQYVNTWLGQNCGIYPGGTPKGKEVLKSGNIALTKDGDWLTITATYPSGQAPAGNLMFGLDSALQLDLSSLFDEQYASEIAFNHYRYGIRFDQFEAGVYDYATNHLLAKYIWGMAPSDAYFDEKANRVTLRFNANVVGGILPSPENFLILDK